MHDSADNISGRREDPALLQGTATYVGDIRPSNLGYMAILRGRYSHANITNLDTNAAEQRPAVEAVYTATDIDQSGIPGNIPTGSSLLNPGAASPVTVNRELVVPPRPLLAGKRVYHAGQPIAVIVAKDFASAHDALTDIDVEYEPLEAVTTPEAAVSTSAPQIHDTAPDNIAFDWEIGPPDTLDDIFQRAPVTVSVDRNPQRLIGNPMEPRGSLATYRNGKLTVTLSTQVPYINRVLISHVLGLPENKIRIRVPNVGGGFGVKSKYYTEEILSAWCAIQLDQPVKWHATRTETYVTDAQGRAHSTHAELALDTDGSIRGLRVEDYKDVGAFVSRGTPAINTGSYATLLSGQYEIPQIYCRVIGTFTTLTPTDAYRGSSRPEATYLVERLMDSAARELDVDPVEIRRQNLIPASEFPYQTPVLAEYDSGDYDHALDRALSLLRYDERRQSQQALRDQGRYVGIGLACFVEKSGSPQPSGLPRTSIEPAHTEGSNVRFHPDGTVTAFCGTADQGQGHRTTYAQILATEFGLDPSDIEVTEGDTDHLPYGTGTFSSRSVIMAGNSLFESAQKVIEDARTIAAQRLEVAVDDVEYSDGTFQVRGVPDRSIELTTIAKESYQAVDLPPDTEPGLAATTFYASPGLTYPYGTHAAVVEIDPETGDIYLDKYIAVDDCGTQINSFLVESQILGGIAQGIGQALYESAEYDDTGSLQTGSLLEYAIPKSIHIPDIETDSLQTPSPRNPLGVKGIGESGPIGAPAAIANAVIDALQPFGVESLPLPLTPETVWRAINQN